MITFGGKPLDQTIYNIINNKAAQIHGRPFMAAKEPVQPLAALDSFLPYGKKILYLTGLSSMYILLHTRLPDSKELEYFFFIKHNIFCMCFGIWRIYFVPKYSLKCIWGIIVLQLLIFHFIRNNIRTFSAENYKIIYFTPDK